MILLLKLIYRYIKPVLSRLRPVSSTIHFYATLFFIPAFFLFSCNPGNNTKQNIKPDSIAIITLPQPAAISKTAFTKIYTACERWYDTALVSIGFNGGMLVASKGNIVFEKYTGTAHLPGNDPITANTSLHIASISKTFTAMAVLKLWQDGKLSLDDEYSKYFPEFNYPGVTLRCLLSHRSGLPNYTYFMENLGWDKTITVHNQDVLQYLITRKASLENIALPCQHFTYCNTNFALLALLIEKVSGKKYADFLNQNFFIPLQMKNTFVFSIADSTRAIPSYDWKGRIIPFGFLDAVYGDKNIYTTVRDLLTWDRALSSGLIFTPQTLEAAYAPYSNEKPGIKNYGLGWRMNIYPDGKKMIYHNGWWHGSNSCLIRLLQDSATIIVIGNKYTRVIYHAKILSNLFGDYYNPEEEEEPDNSRLADGILTTKPDSILVSTKLKQISKDVLKKEKKGKNKN